MFNRSIKQEEDLEEEHIQEAIERLFTIPIFFLLGLVLPWRAWLGMGWPLAIFVAVILLFRHFGRKGSAAKLQALAEQRREQSKQAVAHVCLCS